ncbi:MULTISPECIES: SU10 major capsid protein [unclassified Campylobacter]|uniref:SU10 major capsid protein n=1 Tax=unclassified Campylobacter TaxID=2593542 RepID=UPI0022E9B2FD|nr:MULTISPECIES: DUF5309 family protein [unclassified Campylobacter]MDA3056428.1 DUF5309 domain-containing protein [Campylobacter sp. CN_NA1]MDA3069360.1 DUF5309 domain-containing protein [Campylobacter sp. CN_NE3]
MAITSTGFQSPATKRVGLKPSVYDKIILIGADETPLLSKIGTSSVKGIMHSWITDNIAKPKKNAQAEISDFDDTRKSTKQETTNAVQILTTPIMVSKTMQKVATYGGKELEYETAKRAKEHKLDIEYALFGLGRDNNPKKSVFMPPKIRPAENEAGEMAGFFHFLAKGNQNFTNGARGNVLAFDENGDWTGNSVKLTSQILRDILQRVWESGTAPKTIFVGANLKGAINAMVERHIKHEKKLVDSITAIDTDFGLVEVKLHPFLTDEYGLGDCLVTGDFSFMKNGLLWATTIEDVPTSKTAKQKRLYTECCLEVRNADAFAIGVGLSA